MDKLYSLELQLLRTFVITLIVIILWLSPIVAEDEIGSAPPLFSTNPRVENLLNILPKAKNLNQAVTIRAAIWKEWMNSFKSNLVGEKLAEAMQHLYNNKLDAAEKIFGEIIFLEPDFTEAWNKRATVRYLKGDLIGALNDIDQVLARQKRHFGALSGSGLIYIRLGIPKQALKSYLLVSKIDPLNEEAKKYIMNLTELIYGEAL